MVTAIRALARRARYFPALFVVTLLSTEPVAAGPVTSVDFDLQLSYQYLQFGPGWGYAWNSGGFYGYEHEWLYGPNGEFRILGGEFDLVSGPLTTIVPGPGDSWYVHDTGGSIHLTFDLELRNATHRGSFYAPLHGLTIRASNEAADAGDVTLELGTGVFDPRTARLLGVKQATLPTSVFLWADTYRNYPDPYREVAAFGFLTIRAEVPEPTPLLLWPVAGIAVVCRRRMSR